MTILETIIPVFVMIALGKFLSAKKILTPDGISSIKSVAVNIMLPVMAFDSLIHGSFSKDSLVLIALEIFALAAAFAAGFLLRRFFDAAIRSYVPYAMTTYEGGMFGWALISLLVGQKNMFYIVSMDIFSGIFGFTVTATGLKLISGQKMTRNEIIKSIATNPLVIATVLGFAGAAVHLGEIIDSSKFAGLYSKTAALFIQPLSPLILLCIGAGLVFDRKILAKGLRLALIRYAVQGAICAAVLFVISRTIGLNSALKVSLLVYFFIPTSFLLSMYATDKKAEEFISGLLSLQLIISLLIFSLVSIYAGTLTF